MFESAVDEMLDRYIFDPVQFYLVKINGELTLRYQYLAEYEVTKDISLPGLKVENIQEFVQGIEDNVTPISFELDGQEGSWLFKVKKKAKDGELKASFTAKFGGLPYSWLSFKGKKKDILRLARALSNVA